MENLFFIIVPVVLVIILLIVKFFKMLKEHKLKSAEIQQRIEELKFKNSSLSNIKGNANDIQDIQHQVLELHKKIVDNYLK